MVLSTFWLLGQVRGVWGRLDWNADRLPLVAEPVAKLLAHLGHGLIVEQLHLDGSWNVGFLG